MRAIFIILLWFSIPFASFSQGYIKYYNFVSEAELKYENNGYSEAIKILKKSFRLVDTPQNRDLWMYLDILKIRGKHSKACRRLKSYLRQIGGTSNDLTPYLIKNGYLFSQRQFRKINEIRIDTTNIEYKNGLKFNGILKNMLEVDQKIRLSVDELGGHFSDSVLWSIDGSNTIKVNRLEYSLKISSHNDSVLLDLFIDDRFINNRFIHSPLLSILLLHMSYENFVKIENQMIKMIDLGNMDPYDFASAKDRKYTENGDCLFYFAYALTTNNFSCITEEQVLKNRLLIGLTTYYTRTSKDRYIKPGGSNKYNLLEQMKSKKNGEM